MRRITSTLYYFLAACLISAPAFSQADELIVSAAASLTNTFKDIGKAFEQAHPDTKVLLNFGASDTLLQQIATGAPADVFASADQKSMDLAAAQELIATATRSNFAGNTLVLAVSITAAMIPASLQDLSKPAIARIAIGKPASVPVGRYAKQALDAANLWDSLTAKFIYTQNVRQALDYLARAEVDAGFIYATDAAIMSDKVKIAFVIPLDKPILYPIAVIKDSASQTRAQEFVEFVTGAPGQTILARFGFAKP